MSFFGKILIFISTILFGCNTIQVKTIREKGVDIRSYKTFSWMNGGVFKYSGPIQFSDSILRENLEEVIEKELEAKGLKLDQANPDLLVGVTITLKGSSDRKFRHTQYTPIKSSSDVIYDLSGTLVLAIAGTKESKMIWEGYAIKFLEAGHELSKRRLHKGVKALLEKYPSIN